MYAVKVDAYFSAAHNLREYQGRCENLHGHNWKVEVEICSSQLDKVGMVCDFKDIKLLLSKVLSGLDHAYLNDLPYFKKKNPTSENIAEFIFYEMKKLIKGQKLLLKNVFVWETNTSCAVFNEEKGT